MAEMFLRTAVMMGLFLLIGRNASAVVGGFRIDGHEPSEKMRMAEVTVSIWKKGAVVPYCTGVLIDSQHILTAAHCAYEPGTQIDRLHQSDEIVIRSDFDISKDASVGNFFSLKQIIVHPHYQGFQHHLGLGLFASSLADLAIFVLQSPLVAPIKIQFGFAPQAGQKVRIYGYGDESIASFSSDISFVTKGNLKGADQTVVDGSDILTEQLDIGDKFLMKQGLLDGSCFGDSGGPLWDLSEQQPRLVGILSHLVTKSSAGACGAKGAAVTALAEHLDWITSVVRVCRQPGLPRE